MLPKIIIVAVAAALAMNGVSASPTVRLVTKKIPGVQYRHDVTFANDVRNKKTTKKHHHHSSTTTTTTTTTAASTTTDVTTPSTTTDVTTTTVTTSPTSTPTSGCGVQKAGNLVYNGGPVISNVEVTPLLWGSNVASAAQVATFYNEFVTNSAWLDRVFQYCTPTQSIGNGVGNAAKTLTGFPTSQSLDDTADIQPYLISLVESGALQVNANSYFPIHFAPGISISLQGQGSCSVFCAYHNTISLSGVKNANTPNLMYGIIPDQGGNCAGGCGGAATQFDNTCSVSSHELTEATTDPAIGLVTGNTVGFPAAWYDQTNGEIGDECNAIQTTFKGADGVTYTIQEEWSNNANGCV